VTPLEAAGLFGAYMVPFLLDELVIFGVVVTRLWSRQGAWDRDRSSRRTCARRSARRPTARTGPRV